MTASFSYPGLVQDAPQLQAQWSAEVAAIFDQQVNRCPQFFNPLGADAEVVDHVMRWGAFPKKLSRRPVAERLPAGEDRTRQEEYCEWSGIRDEAGKLVRACFTTETPDYYDFLARNDFPTLVAVYARETGAEVREQDLVDGDGVYDPWNAWNRSHAIHMVQQFNTLSAAIILAAQSSVVRTDDQGEVVTSTADLVRCGISADEDRNSDPLIVTDVNGLARQGGRISLRDPVGLYIHSVQTEGWTTPDGTDPSSFWTWSRGASGMGVRAVYATPLDCDYRISDIEINGSPLTSPSQIAAHVSVRLIGTARSLGTAEPILTPCGDSAPGLEGLEVGPIFPTRTKGGSA